MFGLFRSKSECPVDPATREWIDNRWSWLVEQFGIDRLQKTTVILPSPKFFPDPYNGTAECARLILDKVCTYMDIDPGNVEMLLYEDRNPVYEGQWRQGTAGLYQAEQGQFRIWIEYANLNDPVAMIGTMAHELGHVHLLGHGRIDQNAEDHEPLTDLLTVFFGLGVFTANSVIHVKSWHEGNVSGWSIGRRGYLTMPMYGYALSLFARARGESRSKWVKELRLDVRSAFHESIRFLAQGDESPKLPGDQTST